MLGLLCMSAQAVKVSQNPSTTSTLAVNSSITITCSTTLREAMGLYLYRRFHKQQDVIYLALEKGKISKQSNSVEFEGRAEVKEDTQSGNGLGFTLTLSLLQLHDTNLYYCSWRKLNTVTYEKETHTSNGTIVIIKENVPKRDCSHYSVDIISLALSITAIPFVMCLLSVVLFMACNHFKKKFTPTRAPNMSQRRPLPIPPQPIPPQPTIHTYSYLTTTSDIIDFPY